jgi:hypothetical protein
MKNKDIFGVNVSLAILDEIDVYMLNFINLWFDVHSYDCKCLNVLKLFLKHKRGQVM